MKKGNKPPRNQHYVPQFLLRNFASSKRELIFAYDKKTGNSFQTKVSNVAAENNLYDIELPGGIFSAEPALTEIEGKASIVIKKILGEENLKLLSDDERVIIGLFAAIQMQRVVQLRSDIAEISASLNKKWGPIPGIPGNEEEALKDAGEFLVTNLPNAVQRVPYFINKTWLLLKAHEEAEFYISDNPIALHNKNRNPWRGNLGLAVLGIEIYLPLSSKLTIGFFCKSKEESWLQSKPAIEAAEGFGKPLPADAVIIKNVIQSLENGKPLKTTDTITKFQNELQIWNSSRFVFSKSGNFDFLRNTIEKNPGIKLGRKLVVH